MAFANSCPSPNSAQTSIVIWMVEWRASTWATIGLTFPGSAPT